MGVLSFNAVTNIKGVFTALLVYAGFVAVNIVLRVMTLFFKALRIIQKRNMVEPLVAEGGDSEYLLDICLRGSEKKLGRLQRWLRNHLFWSKLIMIVYQFVPQLTIAVILSFSLTSMSQEKTFSTYVSLGTSIAIMGLLGLLWFISYRIWSAEEQVFKSKTVQTKYSYLIEHLRLKERDARMYNLVYIVRRVSVCFVYLFMYQWPGI